MFQVEKPQDTPALGDVIENDGFWPAISVEDFRINMRLPAEYDSGAVRNALILSMGAINIELNAWTMRGKAKYGSAENSPKLAGEPMLVVNYKMAVFNHAKASLLTHYATLDRRDDAENAAKESQETFNRLMAQSQQAIRNIMGISMVTVSML